MTLKQDKLPPEEIVSATCILFKRRKTCSLHFLPLTFVWFSLIRIIS